MADITITVVEAPVKTTNCGGARSKVKWTAQGTGYIIQHIRIINGRKNCYTDRILALEGWSTDEYWECWKVTNGSVKYDAVTNPKWDDCYELVDQGRTYGSAEIRGEVKFFPNYVLGNAWKKNQVPEAGILRTTRIAPPGWDATGAKAHTLVSSWVCCPRRKEDSSVTGVPLASAIETRKVPMPVRQALNALAAMPKWSEISLDRRARAAIETCAAELGKVNLAAIRSAFRLYLKWAEAQSGGPAIGDLSRLFVANRYLFRLPPQATLGEWPLFGGWHGVSRRDVLDPLWPWKTMRGRKRLAGSFKGYSGGPYLALAEFDYLRRNFPAEIARRSATRSRRKRTVAARSRKA